MSTTNTDSYKLYGLTPIRVENPPERQGRPRPHCSLWFCVLCYVREIPDCESLLFPWLCLYPGSNAISFSSSPFVRCSPQPLGEMVSAPRFRRDVQLQLYKTSAREISGDENDYLTMLGSIL